MLAVGKKISSLYMKESDQAVSTFQHTQSLSW